MTLIMKAQNVINHLIIEVAIYALAKCDTQQCDAMIEDTQHTLNAMRKVLRSIDFLFDNDSYDVEIDNVYTSQFCDNEIVLIEALMSHVDAKVLYALHVLL